LAEQTRSELLALARHAASLDDRKQQVNPHSQALADTGGHDASAFGTKWSCCGRTRFPARS
jgi:hypothetical protein